MTIDAEDYMDRSKFLTVQVDINNIDYEGDERNGEGETKTVTTYRKYDK